MTMSADRARVTTFVAVSPLFLYPIFLMKIYCFIIFACAYNLLLGYSGLNSFGHAAFFGGAAYRSRRDGQSPRHRLQECQRDPFGVRRQHEKPPTP